ncbi:Uncharacterised protein [Mycobacterium tuberculosis]|nr:Uncharacterised protein [Mycobacterium tuberculosis]
MPPYLLVKHLIQDFLRPQCVRLKKLLIMTKFGWLKSFIILELLIQHIVNFIRNMHVR